MRQNFTAREMSAVENKENIQEPPNKKLCKMPVESVMMQFAKLSKNAFSPTRGSKLAAGYDLYRYSIELCRRSTDTAMHCGIDMMFFCVFFFLVMFSFWFFFYLVGMH